MRFEGELLPAGGPAAIGRIVMVGAGASWITSLIGKFMIEELCGDSGRGRLLGRVPLSPAADRRAHDDDRGVAVGRDRRHAGRDGRRARSADAICWRITNTVDSSIARKADAQFYTRCGPEISVTTTKCFLTQIEAFYLFAIHLAARLGRLSEREADASCSSRPSRSRRKSRQSSRSERQIEQIARKYGKARDFLYLGRGINYPVALEGALKLKEISYIHAEGYSAGEMKHGPIALIDEEMPVVVIIPNRQRLREDAVESEGGRIAQRPDHRRHRPSHARARGGRVGDNRGARRRNRMLMPVLTTVPLQLLAYHIAVYRGTDVDQPRNLAKSVTVE